MEKVVVDMIPTIKDKEDLENKTPSTTDNQNVEELRKLFTPDRLKVPKAFKYPERYRSPTDAMMSPITKGLLARNRKPAAVALLPPSLNNNNNHAKTKMEKELLSLFHSVLKAADAVSLLPTVQTNTPESLSILLRQELVHHQHDKIKNMALYVLEAWKKTPTVPCLPPNTQKFKVRNNVSKTSKKTIYPFHQKKSTLKL
ncbi:hypothetical protein ACFE04_006638 [Oxalis oulophora]